MRKKTAIIVCLLVVMSMVVASAAVVAKGKPQKDEPPADPAIAYLKFKANYGYKMMVMNADGARQTTVYDPGGSLISPDWSPDGTSIAFARYSELWTIDIEVVDDVPQGSNLRMLWADSFLGDPDWSPDGDVIAITSGYSSSPPSVLWSISAEDGTPVDLYTADDGFTISNVAWSHDASKIAFFEDSAEGKFINILDVSEKTVTKTFEIGYHVLSLDWAWAEKQDVLVYNMIIPRSKNPFHIYTLDIGDGVKTRIAEGYSPSFSPDDTQIVFSTVTGRHDVIVYDFATGQTEKLGRGSEPDWRRF